MGNGDKNDKEREQRERRAADAARKREARGKGRAEGREEYEERKAAEAAKKREEREKRKAAEIEARLQWQRTVADAKARTIEENLQKQRDKAAGIVKPRARRGGGVVVPGTAETYSRNDRRPVEEAEPSSASAGSATTGRETRSSAYSFAAPVTQRNIGQLDSNYGQSYHYANAERSSHHHPGAPRKRIHKALTIRSSSNKVESPRVRQAGNRRSTLIFGGAGQTKVQQWQWERARREGVKSGFTV
ncbi:hypothetical protein LTR85_006424 [Meristemomyces frigidus]|nr:hypothetical protein LTR85_006424 [Meristemomyces frigidus]